MGKSGDVAQPSSFAFGLVAGGLQSFAPGNVTHVTTVPDCEELRHTVPSLEVSDNSKVCGVVIGEADEPSLNTTPVMTRFPVPPAPTATKSPLP
jgi:hypothetical protein